MLRRNSMTPAGRSNRSQARSSEVSSVPDSPTTRRLPTARRRFLSPEFGISQVSLIPPATQEERPRILRLRAAMRRSSQDDRQNLKIRSLLPVLFELLL